MKKISKPILEKVFSLYEDVFKKKERKFNIVSRFAAHTDFGQTYFDTVRYH